jgi:hypothetical protein
MPYNAYLSLDYNIYINVKLYITVRAIKYINKYVFKSSDIIILKVS